MLIYKPMNLLLRHLTLRDEKQFFLALNEDWGDFVFAHYFDSLAGSHYEKYVEILPMFSKQEVLPEGHVPCTFLFAFDEFDKIVGRVSIRHKLNENLRLVGGHIGYGVVPRERRKGYATKILDLSLKYIKENIKNLDNVLVTCDDGNVGSQKTIENNYGVLENIIDVNGVKKRRYWIEV